MPRKKVGIALGGGAARGIAHIGVLEVLDREGIPIDIVAGTSAGAAIGALYCSGISPLRLKEVIEGFDWNRRRKLLDISVPHTGFIAGEKLMHEIRELMGGDLKFEDLQKPFACVACDLLTGEEAIMTKGPVVEAIHASIAIPLIFQAVHRKGRYLVDGGLVNQVPVNVVKAMGAEYIIAVNVVPIHVQKLRAQMVEREDNETESSPRPSLSSVMMSVFDIANSSRIEANLRGANVVIEPRMTQIGPADFHKAKLSILQGEMAAIDAVLKIKRDLAMA